MTTLKQYLNRKNVGSALLILVVGLLIFLVMSNRSENEPVGEITQTEGEVFWKNYTNKKFGFELKFPSAWHLHEDFSTDSPIINFYPRTPGARPPFNHFSENAHFSVFPAGIPTDGIIGAQELITDFELQEETESVVSFVLDSDDPWAYMIYFQDKPSEWRDWGFLWIRNNVQNYQESCVRDGVEVSVFECDIFQGDEIVRSGEIDAEISELMMEVLNSFTFTD